MTLNTPGHALTQSSTILSPIKVTLVIEGEQEAARESGDFHWASVGVGGGQPSVNGDVWSRTSGHLNTSVPKSPLTGHQACPSTPGASLAPSPSSIH